MFDLESLNQEEITKGYVSKQNEFICLSCGKVFKIGEIFKLENRFFDAINAIQIHIETEHTNRFDELLDSDNKYISLTDNQKELLNLFYEGLSDNEIAKKLKVTPSTVRHQKFMFREKAKSAKMYLAIWQMTENQLKENKKSNDNELLSIHGGAKMVDERYVITEKESKKIMEDVFESLEPLKLKIFSSKEKKKIVILRTIIQKFEKNKQYAEKEVNEILKSIYEDYVIIRRYLIEYGYMDRTKDCKIYWLR